MTLEELKHDPRNGKERAIWASIDCLDKGIVDIPGIFTAIDEAYSVGKHRAPSYIKGRKNGIVRFLNKHPELLNRPTDRVTATDSNIR